MRISIKLTKNEKRTLSSLNLMKKLPSINIPRKNNNNELKEIKHVPTPLLPLHCPFNFCVTTHYRLCPRPYTLIKISMWKFHSLTHWLIWSWASQYIYTHSVPNWCINSLKHYFSGTKETKIQFLLCMMQKAHSSCVYKWTWQRDYHSVNVSDYWSVIGKWRIMLIFNNVEGLNLVHHH